ncbi:MAG: inositol transport system substrate-binding protein [Solirubrobacterales bacterium]|nr:inositol transport system substrate-binding protein [Solirubrobacterales bacterium]
MGNGERAPGSRRGRLFAGAVSALVLAFGVAACGGDDDDGDSGGSASGGEARDVYLNAYAQEIQYFRDWFDGATAQAEELGWTVESEFGNTTPEQQVQQLENAIVQQPDAIVLTPLDEQSVVPVLQQAEEQGIAVITVGATAGDDAGVDSFVARDNVEIGRQKAQFVVDELGGKGKVGVIHGIRGLTFSEEMAQGYEEVLSESSGIEVVDGPYAGGFSGDLGLETTENLLTANPDLDAIIYDNDDLALGGVEAASARNITPEELIVIGTDGGDAALDAVEAGDIDMTVSLCGYREGASAIDTLNTFLEEGDVDDRVVSEVEIFTTDNIEEKRADLSREDCA